jgi:FdhD protein
MNPVERVRVRTIEGGRDDDRDDDVAVEEPLVIQIRREGSESGFAFVTTMRTPGNDVELAAGLLFAEGVIEGPADIVRLAVPDPPGGKPDGNVVVATLSCAAVERAEKLQRASVMGSACGVCGKTTIDNLIPAGRPAIADRLRVDPEILLALPRRLRERQSIFASTGGLHAAGLFTFAGELEEVREDIGRHNATDKLVGACLLRGRIPLSGGVLVVSGRAGFEIVQKAVAAGIPLVASVSAPSSLAVALADAGGVTLVGFLRDRRFNVYSHRQRVSASKAYGDSPG